MSKEELISVRNSYLNILTLFLAKDKVDSKYVGCLIKWAVQLQFEGEDLRDIETNFHKLAFNMPETSADKLDAIIDLVRMIYMDNVVEDIEMELASIYAEQLGFEKHAIAEIFLGLSTGSIKGEALNDVKDDLKKIIGK